MKATSASFRLHSQPSRARACRTTSVAGYTVPSGPVTSPSLNAAAMTSFPASSPEFRKSTAFRWARNAFTIASGRFSIASGIAEMMYQG